MYHCQLNKTPKGEKRKKEMGQLDIFDRIGSAEPSKSSNYVLEGVYPLLEVRALKIVTNRNNEDLFIAELLVLKSLVPQRSAGMGMAWIANFRYDATWGNVREMIAATMNAATSEVDSKAAQFACSDRNPCAGRLVSLEAVDIETKAGKTFTRCAFKSVSDEDQTKKDEYKKQLLDL